MLALQTQGRTGLKPSALQRLGREAPFMRMALPGARILHLRCSGNILWFRSEAGRTDEWARAHFFVGPVGVQCRPAKVEESLRGFGKNPRCCREGGAFGSAGSR